MKKALAILVIALSMSLGLIGLTGGSASASTQTGPTAQCASDANYKNQTSSILYTNVGYAYLGTTSVGADQWTIGTQCPKFSGAWQTTPALAAAVLVQRFVYPGVWGNCLYNYVSIPSGHLAQPYSAQAYSPNAPAGVCQQQNYPLGWTRMSTSTTVYDQGNQITLTDLLYDNA